MRIKAKILMLICLFFTAGISAQTAEEIVDAYIENLGGAEALHDIKSTRITANVNYQGMQLPVLVVATKDGKQIVVVEIQGQKIVQLAFDGDVAWGTNFMTMKPEKSDIEVSEMMKLDSNDFPEALLDYKKKSYQIELVGEETVEGVETYKLKLIAESAIIEGKEEQSLTYYYFDKKNYLPVVIEKIILIGPMKGQSGKTILSDYRKVEGIYFPFSITQGGQPVIVAKIEVNGDIDESMFTFPE